MPQKVFYLCILVAIFCVFLFTENCADLISDYTSTIVLNRTHYGVQQIDEFLKENDYSTELIKDNNYVNYDSDSVKICTMSSIKGLEFNSVFILDLNDDVIPSPNGFIDSDDDYHISTERRLLYTCMTRAENNLYLFSSNEFEPSRYLNEIDSVLLEKINHKKVKRSSGSDDLPF